MHLSFCLGVTLLFQYVSNLERPLTLTSIERNVFSDLQGTPLPAVCFGGCALLLLAVFSSHLVYLCLSVYDFHVGQGQALTRLFLSVTGVKGYLFGPKGTHYVVNMVCQNTCTANVHRFFHIALWGNSKSK